MSVQALRGDPRALGVVYTPPEVTEPMTRIALEPLLAGRSVDEIRALRVCDPAIGEGAFLVARGRLSQEEATGSELFVDEVQDRKSVV